MQALHELQRAFAASLSRMDDRAIAVDIVEGGFSAAERLRIYRNSCHSTLTAALRTTYPAVERLVGREFFDAAADAFIALDPPHSACLNDYGGAFGDFIETYPPAAAIPYLGDVARFEWALSVAAHAVDAPRVEPQALAALEAHAHASLRFQAHPSVTCLVLQHPADQIADAVLSGDEAAMAQLDLSGAPVHLVVHRGHEGIEVQRVEPDAFRFIMGLCAGAPLGHLVQAAPPYAPKLLAEQLTKGRLQAFCVSRDHAHEEGDAA